jgi:hypothetical protein
MAYLLLNEKSLYFRRADFEPQRASPFIKGLKAPELLSEATRASTVIPLFVLLFILSVVLASSTSGDQNFMLQLCCAKHHSIRIEGKRKRLVTPSPVMTKRVGRLEEKNYRRTAS